MREEWDYQDPNSLIFFYISREQYFVARKYSHSLYIASGYRQHLVYVSKTVDYNPVVWVSVISDVCDFAIVLREYIARAGENVSYRIYKACWFSSREFYSVFVI